MARIPIFYYHSVGGPPPQTLALDTFRRHLDLLEKHGVSTTTVARRAAGTAPPRSAVLAFDDGLLDNYQNVFPLLRERRMVATFYVVPAYDAITRWVNPSNGRWSDVERSGYTIPFLSMGAAQRRELVAAGCEIGSHTLTHRKLTHIPRCELRAEIAGSKLRLEDELGLPVETFCYPNGRFNLEVLREVRAAGYRAACSTIPGYFGPRFLQPRFLVENPDYFEAVLLGRAFDWRAVLRLLRQRAGSKTG